MNPKKMHEKRLAILVEISSVCKPFVCGGAYEARTRDLMTASRCVFIDFSMLFGIG